MNTDHNTSPQPDAKAADAILRLVTEYVEEHGEQTRGHAPFGILRLRLDMELGQFLDVEHLADVVESSYGVYLAEQGTHPGIVRNAAYTVNNQPELLEFLTAHRNTQLGHLLAASGLASKAAA